jgi:hypothetical protein
MPTINVLTLRSCFESCEMRLDDHLGPSNARGALGLRTSCCTDRGHSGQTFGEMVDTFQEGVSCASKGGAADALESEH